MPNCSPRRARPRLLRAKCSPASPRRSRSSSSFQKIAEQSGGLAPVSGCLKEKLLESIPSKNRTATEITNLLVHWKMNADPDDDVAGLVLRLPKEMALTMECAEELDCFTETGVVAAATTMPISLIFNEGA